MRVGDKRTRALHTRSACQPTWGAEEWTALAPRSAWALEYRLGLRSSLSHVPFQATGGPCLPVSDAAVKTPSRIRHATWAGSTRPFTPRASPIADTPRYTNWLVLRPWLSCCARRCIAATVSPYFLAPIPIAFTSSFNSDAKWGSEEVK